MIVARLEEDADDFGTTVEEMIADFNYLKNFSPRELSRALRQALCGIKDDSPVQTQVENALAWYALESVAYEMTDAH